MMNRVHKLLCKFLVVTMMLGVMAPAVLATENGDKREPAVKADSAPVQITNSYGIADIRDHSHFTTMGKTGLAPTVLIFGGYGGGTGNTGCMNTQNIVRTFSNLLETDFADSDLKVGYFPIRYDGDYDMASITADLSDKMYIADTSWQGQFYYANDYNAPHRQLFWQCYQFATGGSGSYTMPMVAYVNYMGQIVSCTTGAQTEAKIREQLANIGVGSFSSFSSTIDVTGTRDYTLAYEVFDQLNQYRVENGLNALTMDQSLLESAMVRAAETVVYWDHTRPTGESASTINPLMNSENIAYGYGTSTAVMTGWKNSAGHNANMLKSGINSVGIGAFRYNGILYWVQVFGPGAGTSATRINGQVNTTTTVAYASHTAEVGFASDAYALTAGGTQTRLRIYIGEIYTYDLTGYTVESSNTSVVQVSNGMLVPISGGSATITLKFGDIEVDTATVDVVGATSTPTPIATSTPSPTATSTPSPTATSAPTATPTNVPTATSTPSPTATSAPTATPTNAPTVGPRSDDFNTYLSDPYSEWADTIDFTGWYDLTNRYFSDGVYTLGDTVEFDLSTTDIDAGDLYFAYYSVPSTVDLNVDFSHPVAQGVANYVAYSDGNFYEFRFTPSYPGYYMIVVAESASAWAYGAGEYLVYACCRVDNIPSPTATNTPTPPATSTPTTIPTATEAITATPTTEPTSAATGTPVPTSAPTVTPVLTGVEGFVARLYSQVLGRNSNASERSYWVNKINNGMSGADVARNFFNSPEFTSKSLTTDQFLTIAYSVFFDRTPDASGRSYYTRLMANGMTKMQVVNSMINSIEWATTCYNFGIQSGGNPTSGMVGFATRLYTECLGRTAVDAAGRNYWVNALSRGTKTGTAAAREFFFGAEFTNQHNSPVEFVRRLYRTMYGRDADTSGLNYWVGKINGGMTYMQVFNNFAAAPEWARICTQYGIQK